MKERKISKLFEKIGIMLFTVILVYLSFLIVNKVYIKHYEKSLKDYEWVVNRTELVKNQDFGLNVYMVEKNRKISIYNKHYRKAIDENIERLKEEAYYTLEEPLLLFNPYGTNNVGLNIYFETEKELKVEYTIRVKSTSKIPEYSNTLYNKDEYTKIHEYQIIGLVAENINELELRLIDKEGNEEKRKFVFDLTEVRYLSQIKLETTTGNETEEELTNGLYTILGNDSNKLDYVAMYDNNGILRMEIPIIGYRAHKILFANDRIYFSISQSKIVEIDRLGKITEIYNTGKYQLHHDYVFDHEGNMLVLAKNT